MSAAGMVTVAPAFAARAMVPARLIDTGGSARRTASPHPGIITRGHRRRPRQVVANGLRPRCLTTPAPRTAAPLGAPDLMLPTAPPGRSPRPVKATLAARPVGAA